jgi:hypothetical protein
VEQHLQDAVGVAQSQWLLNGTHHTLSKPTSIWFSPLAFSLLAGLFPIIISNYTSSSAKLSPPIYPMAYSAEKECCVQWIYVVSISGDVVFGGM